MDLVPDVATVGVPKQLFTPALPEIAQVIGPDGAGAPDGPVRDAVKIIFPPSVPSPSPVMVTTGLTGAILIEMGVVVSSVV